MECSAIYDKKNIDYRIVIYKAYPLKLEMMLKSTRS